MAEQPKRMDIAEFRELGYLQELNRQFLHPLGLALEVRTNEDGTEELSGIWDYRDDPEGIMFGEPPDCEAAYRIRRLREQKRDARTLLKCCDAVEGIQQTGNASAGHRTPQERADAVRELGEGKRGY